jgi:hypothetical protein
MLYYNEMHELDCRRVTGQIFCSYLFTNTHKPYKNGANNGVVLQLGVPTRPLKGYWKGLLLISIHKYSQMCTKY